MREDMKAAKIWLLHNRPLRKHCTFCSIAHSGAQILQRCKQPYLVDSHNRDGQSTIEYGNDWMPLHTVSVHRRIASQQAGDP